MEQPLKKKQTQYVDGEVFRGGGYKPTGKEMPERYYFQCKTIAIDKNLAEKYLEQYGSKIEPIKQPLTERKGIVNLNGAILGTPKMSIRSVTQLLNF